MTNPSVVIEMLGSLIDAGLDFSPKNIDGLVDIWVRVFTDIPDDIFTQAVSDYLITETKWPAPAKIRKVAERVKANSGKSTAGGWFKDETRVERAGEIPGFWRVVDFGKWEIFIPDPDFVADTQTYPMIEPPKHPIFQSWLAAQKWMEDEKRRLGIPLLHEVEILEGVA